MQIATLPGLRPDPRSDVGCELASTSERIPYPWVRRDRLHARLDEATQRTATIVTGPPGSGKTALVAGWASSCNAQKVVWLTPLRGVISLPSVVYDPSSYSEYLGNGRPVLVVVDDIHLIRDRRAAVALEEFAEQLPANFRVVLVGRHVGLISRSRLRLRAPVSEVDGWELDFTREEAGLLLDAFGLHLESEALTLLLRETQGWAAGLRLAAVLMSDRSDPQDVIGSLNTVGGPFSDYIEAEVLPHLLPAEIDALSRASIVQPLHESVCEVLTDRPDVLQRFESLAGRNLFVSQSAAGYDLHPVFAHYLRHRLETADREVMVDVHLKAAECMKEEGDFETALDHYVAAKHFDKALELGATQLVRALTDGSIPGGSALLPGGVPDSYFTEDPARMYLLCASLIWSSRLQEARQCLARLKVGLDGSPPLERDRVRVEWLGTLLDSAALDAEGVLEHAERANDLITHGRHLSIATARPDWLVALDNAVANVLPWIVARAQAVLGRVDIANQVLRTEFDGRRLPLGALALGSSAAIALEGGRLREAAALAHRGRDACAEHAGASVVAVESRVVLAGVLFERDELEAARLELVEARQIAERLGLTNWIALVDCDVARLCLAEGQPHRALLQVQAVRQAEIGCGLLDSRLDALEFDCRLALHDIEGAQYVLSGMGPKPSMADSTARLYLSAGRPDKAVTELGRAPSHRHSRRGQIEHLLLQARIKLLSGNPTASEHILKSAVESGRTEHFVRVFLEQPAQLFQSLKSIYSTQHDDYVDELLSRFQSQTGSQASIPIQIVEPLTERERELIVFLPSHLTQLEIARKMYISPNTVKTHMKALYRKLGAQSRSEAVELAQLCGLL